MAAAAILSCYLVTLDHSRSLLHDIHGPNIVLKFHVNRITTVRCAHLNVLQICLKNPIPTPKIYVFGGFAPKHYCASSQPPKSTSLAKTASYGPLSVTRHTTNDTVRSITGCLPVSEKVKSFCLRFFGHLARSAPEDDRHRVIAAALRPPTD